MLADLSNLGHTGTVGLHVCSLVGAFDQIGLHSQPLRSIGWTVFLHYISCSLIELHTNEAGQALLSTNVAAEP